MVNGLSARGIFLGGVRPAQPTKEENAATADEFFIAGFNKLLDPGEDFQIGKRAAVAYFDRALSINPRYTIAYFMRAIVKEDLNDSQGTLADYDKALSLNPQLATAYYNRGNLKYRKLNNRAEAIADFRTTAKLFRAQGQTQYLQLAIDILRELGATETP